MRHAQDQHGGRGRCPAARHGHRRRAAAPARRCCRPAGAGARAPPPGSPEVGAGRDDPPRLLSRTFPLAAGLDKAGAESLLRELLNDEGQALPSLGTEGASPPPRHSSPRCRSRGASCCPSTLALPPDDGTLLVALYGGRRALAGLLAETLGEVRTATVGRAHAVHRADAAGGVARGAARDEDRRPAVRAPGAAAGAARPALAARRAPATRCRRRSRRT